LPLKISKPQTFFPNIYFQNSVVDEQQISKKLNRKVGKNHHFFERFLTIFDDFLAQLSDLKKNNSSLWHNF
jgi:hypothetical protein